MHRHRPAVFLGRVGHPARLGPRRGEAVEDLLNGLREHVAIQKGTRVLILLWDSLMFGRVPGTRPNISESHSEMSTRVPFCIEVRTFMRMPD